MHPVYILFTSPLQKVNEDGAPLSPSAQVSSEAAPQSTTPKTKPKPKPREKGQDEKALEEPQSHDKSQDGQTLEHSKQTDRHSDGAGNVTENQKTAVLGNTAAQEEPKKESDTLPKVPSELANSLKISSTNTELCGKETPPVAEKGTGTVPASGAQPEH